MSLRSKGAIGVRVRMSPAHSATGRMTARIRCNPGAACRTGLFATWKRFAECLAHMFGGQALPFRSFVLQIFPSNRDQLAIGDRDGRTDHAIQSKPVECREYVAAAEIGFVAGSHRQAQLVQGRRSGGLVDAFCRTVGWRLFPTVFGGSIPRGGFFLAGCHRLLGFGYRPADRRAPLGHQGQHYESSISRRSHAAM